MVGVYKSLIFMCFEKGRVMHLHPTSFRWTSTAVAVLLTVSLVRSQFPYETGKHITAVLLLFFLSCRDILIFRAK